MFELTATTLENYQEKKYQEMLLAEQELHSRI